MYLEKFTLPDQRREDDLILLHTPPELLSGCYNVNNAYPFHIFPIKGIKTVEFAPITFFCGSNGSGKSTLLNVIAEKLSLGRSAPFNLTPMLKHYLALCDFELSYGAEDNIKDGQIITSDDVFDFLLDIRNINLGIARRRNELYRSYREAREQRMPAFSSLEELDEFKRQNEVRRVSRSAYTEKRMPGTELNTASNGESAFSYFTRKIKEGTLYLLDEPENSLSPALRKELLRFIEDSARFYGCQFIIGTHCPFLLSAKGAVIYDLDLSPVRQVRWEETECVRCFRELFDGKG